MLSEAALQPTSCWLPATFPKRRNAGRHQISRDLPLQNSKSRQYLLWLEVLHLPAGKPELGSTALLSRESPWVLSQPDNSLSCPDCFEAAGRASQAGNRKEKQVLDPREQVMNTLPRSTGSGSGWKDGRTDVGRLAKLLTHGLAQRGTSALGLLLQQGLGHWG